MADETITTPLLTQQPQTQQPHSVISIDPSPPSSQNPFQFLGIDGFINPNSTTADPFRNHTLKIEGVYEWFKTLICLPIAFIRLVLFGFAIFMGYLTTAIAHLGWEYNDDDDDPMPVWRSGFMWVTRFCARCILFSFGFQWIKRKGRPVSREMAPIVVSNHVSFIEPIFFFYELFPTIVTSESHNANPFIGPIIRSMQVILVDRSSSESRSNAVTEIKKIAACNRLPRVLIFPEGTTTNGRFLLPFRNGAFIPGYPVQPVVVRYPYVHFDHSWSIYSLTKLLFRMFTQFHNFMEVEYLPVMQPLPSEEDDQASAFAEQTACAIATALNVVQTPYTYGDMVLRMRADELKQENPSRFVVGLGHADLTQRIRSAEALEFLDVFFSMSPDNSGCVKFDDFVRALRLKPCDISRKIFAFIDVEKSGKITFKQFLLASTHVMKKDVFEQTVLNSFAKFSNGEDDHVSEREWGDFIGRIMPYINRDDMEEVCKMFDMDGDGRISKEDFCKCLKRNPLLIALFGPHL